MRTVILQILQLLLTVSLAGAATPELSVSLAVPTKDGDRVLLLHERGGHFHVLVSNVSDEPQRVWMDSCSWGYNALTFELADAAGKTWIVKKQPSEWSKNSPNWWTLAPGEPLVLDVHFADTNVWEGFPRPVNASQVVSVRAIFEIKPDKFSDEYKVWTGRVSSDVKKLTFYHYKK